MAALKREMHRIKNSHLGTGDIVFIRARVAAGAGGEQDAILVDVDGPPPQRQWAYRDALWKYTIVDLSSVERHYERLAGPGDTPFAGRRHIPERRQDFNRAWTPFQARRINTQDRRKSWPR